MHNVAEVYGYFSFTKINSYKQTKDTFRFRQIENMYFFPGDVELELKPNQGNGHTGKEKKKVIYEILPAKICLRWPLNCSQPSVLLEEHVSSNSA